MISFTWKCTLSPPKVRKEVRSKAWKNKVMGRLLTERTPFVKSNRPYKMDLKIGFSTKFVKISETVKKKIVLPRIKRSVLKLA